MRQKKYRTHCRLLFINDLVMACKNRSVFHKRDAKYLYNRRLGHMVWWIAFPPHQSITRPIVLENFESTWLKNIWEQEILIPGIESFLEICTGLPSLLLKYRLTFIIFCLIFFFYWFHAVHTPNNYLHVYYLQVVT